MVPDQAVPLVFPLKWVKSLEILKDCQLEPGLAEAAPESRFQFERLGYFCVDSKISSMDAPVFNRTVTLRDTWAKIQKQRQQKKMEQSKT